MQHAAQRSVTVSGTAFRLRMRVYYEDTDAGGVVYYANYLKFCERARTEWLRDCGFDQRTLLDERHLAFVVRSLEAEFRRPALLDDEIEVVTRVAALGRASIVFDHEVRRRDATLFSARVKVACVELPGPRPVAVPQDIRLAAGRSSDNE